MKSEHLKVLLLIGIVVGILLVGSYYIYYNQKEKNKLKVGIIGPLHLEENVSRSVLNSVQLALGSEDSSKIKPFFVEANCSEKEINETVQKLIDFNEVDAIIEAVCPEATLAASRITEANKVVLITASTHSKISTDGEYTFRTVTPDAKKGEFAAKLLNDGGFKKSAILYSNKQSSIEFKDALEENYAGEIVSEQLFENQAPDVRVQILKVRYSNPEAVYIITDSPQSTRTTLEQAKDMKLNVPLFGSDGMMNEKALQTKNNAGENLIVFSTTSGTNTFRHQYLSVYNEEPGIYAAQGYDAMLALIKASQLGANSGEEARLTLHEIEFDGASGHIKFDENGNPPANYDTYQIKENQFVKI